MIDNIEVFKKQLKGLAELINSFKSESVQLRVLDLVFQRLRFDTPKIKSRDKLKKGTMKIPSSFTYKKPPSKNKIQKVRQPKATRPGPGAILNRLYDKGFFKAKRTIDDMKNNVNLSLHMHILLVNFPSQQLA